MSDIKLSKDATKVLCTIYKEYLSRIKQGVPKPNAIIFEIRDITRLFPNIDISIETSELSNNSLINQWINGEFELSQSGIIYMENRVGDTIDKIVDFISKLKP